jgi:hypothetical protein
MVVFGSVCVKCVRCDQPRPGIVCVCLTFWGYFCYVRNVDHSFRQCVTSSVLSLLFFYVLAYEISAILTFYNFNKRNTKAPCRRYRSTETCSSVSNMM